MMRFAASLYLTSAVLILVLSSVVSGNMVVSTPSTHTVRRNVLEYGAKGDGVTDDTQAFIRALTEGKATQENPGVWNNSQYGCRVTTPTLVYVPSGIYIISATLPVVYNTQFVGDFEKRPTLLFENADCKASGPMAMVDAGQDQQGHGWYPDQNQNNFYRIIRNLIIDGRGSPSCKYVLHWQVAQATNLEHLDIFIPSGQNGIYGESGSGGYFNSVNLYGNDVMYPISMGNQQFTLRNITVNTTGTCPDAIYILWGWSWSLIDIRINSAGGIRLGNPLAAISIIDSVINGPWIAVALGDTTSLEIDNVNTQGVTQPVNVYSKSGVHTYYPFPGSFYTLKPFGSGGTTFSGKTTAAPARSNLLARALQASQSPSQPLLPRPMYLGWMRPHYPAKDVVNASQWLQDKSGTDVTSILQTLINNATRAQKALFLPFGEYLITDTIIIPAGSRIFGEVWTNLVATGENFANASSPRVVIQVGEEKKTAGGGNDAPVHLADLLFTNKGPIPGAKFVEWNVGAKLPTPAASSTIDVSQVSGIWDCHFRIGGANNTDQDEFTCPKNATIETHPECRGAYSLLHFSKTAKTVFVSSLWAWVADHNIDSKGQNGTNIYNARGISSESSGPIWMYGAAGEHSMLYQLNLAKDAAHTLVTIFQTETPYFQPETPIAVASAPALPSDPPVGNSTMHALAIAIEIPKTDLKGRYIQLHGAAMYSFFDRWQGGCKECQEELFLVYDRTDSGAAPPGIDSSLQFSLLNTHGSEQVATLWAQNASAATYENGFCATTSYFGFNL